MEAQVSSWKTLRLFRRRSSISCRTTTCMITGYSTGYRRGGVRKDYTYYLDYSIGFLTRGCFRKCEFCVNKNYNRCVVHSPIQEFFDPSRPKLCFLDDNFLACPKWESILREVQETGKRFQFKQGLDARLLTDKKIRALVNSKYDGDYIFAFDNINDRETIEKKLARFWELYPNNKFHLKFYVLCGYDENGQWDEDFWEKDIADTFERIAILRKYKAVPYVMRFEKCYSSPWHGIYSVIAAWANQPSFFKKFTFRDFCKYRGMGNKIREYKVDFDRYLADGNPKGASWRYLEELESAYPTIAREHFDVRFPDS